MWPGRLYIKLRAAQAWQQVRFLSYQQMRAIELRANVDAQIKLRHRGKGLFGIGQRYREVSPQANQGLGRTVYHCLHCLDGIMSVRLRRLEPQYILNLLKEAVGGFLGDSNRSISLHIGMATQWTDACAGLAKVSSQEQQVRDQADIGSALTVLGHAHAIGNDRRIRFCIEICDLLKIRTGESARLFDVFPRRCCQVRCKRVEAFGMRRDKITVQNVSLRCVHRHERLHDALEGCRISSGVDLVIR